MIRRCFDEDFDQVWEVINDGAKAYEGSIPADRYEDPYMTKGKLRDEVNDGVEFWGLEGEAGLAGVMGIQKVRDVTLIRHAYVRTTSQRRGIGTKLLSHLRMLTHTPVLIGTWADAVWAIRFYEGHGFRVVSPREKELLLRTYWTVPARQIETSILLTDERWRAEGRLGEGVL